MLGNDGWTTVQRRRRRRGRPKPQPYRGHGAGTGRGMDSVLPVPSWGQGPFPRPNLPVPPAGWYWYHGPQERSYADVVVGRPAQTSRPAGRNDGGHIQQQPADPLFGQLVRKLHLIIKMVHHLQNVAPKSGKEEPRMISRMVDVLTSMIKPASPTSLTHDLIWGNAKNWGYNTLLILQQHYQDGLEALLNETESLLNSDWRSAFEVATRWARRNLTRITQEVIDHAEALITARATLERREAQPSADVPATNRQTSQDAQQQTTFTQQASVVHTPTQPTRDDQLQASSSVNTPRSSVGRPLVASIVSLDEQPSPAPSGAAGGRLSVDSGLVTPCESPKPAHGWEISPGSDLLDMREEYQSPILIPEQPSRHSTSGLTSESSQSRVSHSTPKSQRVRVIRHANSTRKMIDWDLNVEKKWLIMGDSNLARISGHSIQDLQIDSYPGANFRHAQALLSKATSEVMVEKLVLSFGINSRGQLARETAVKQMQAAVRTAKMKFPCAEIWIPVINFSTSLTTAEQATLKTLNGHITRNMPFIPALSSSVFRTERDEIHWTKNTANAMLDHWLTFLNWSTPQASSRRGAGILNP